jgi:hypothetical protein
MDDKVLKFAEIYKSEALRRIQEALKKDVCPEVQVSRGVDDSGRGERAVTGGTCQTKS